MAATWSEQRIKNSFEEFDDITINGKNYLILKNHSGNAPGRGMLFVIIDPTQSYVEDGMKRWPEIMHMSFNDDTTHAEVSEIWDSIKENNLDKQVIEFKHSYNHALTSEAANIIINIILRKLLLQNYIITARKSHQTKKLNDENNSLLIDQSEIEDPVASDVNRIKKLAGIEKHEDK